MTIGVWEYLPKISGMDQKTVHNHLSKMPVLANRINADLSQGFTVAQAHMSAQHFNPGVVSAMQKKRILGVTGRYVIILKQIK